MEEIDKEGVGELVHSIAHGDKWEEVEDRKSCCVWVMRSKDKFLVREGVLKKWPKRGWKGRVLSKGGKCYAQSADSILKEAEVEWERKPEYAHMYYSGMLGGKAAKDATCFLEEARVFKMPLPRSRYNSDVWEFVRCRLVEEVVEKPMDDEMDIWLKYRRDKWF